MKQKWLYFICLVVIAAMVLTACGGSAATASKGPVPLPASPKTVTGSWTQEPDNVVPYYTTMSYADWIAQLTLAGLGKWNDKNELIPELATEIPSVENGGVSPDGLTITWKLKPNLLWSDGEPLTSADVKFTWEQVVDPANGAVQTVGYDKVASIETPDNTTVVIKFKELFPPWQVMFTQGPNNAGAILPAHILKGKTGLNKDPFIRWPNVASGAWVITDWVAGDHMQLLPNPNYFRGRPKLDQILIKFIPNPETTLAALQTGDVDWYSDFSESDIETLSKLEPAIHLKVVPGSDFEHYGFTQGSVNPVVGQDPVESKSDQDSPCYLKDYKFRKAVIYGINRQAIVDALLMGKTTVPASQWPNSTWTNSSLVPEPFDPEKAKALLDEAGYKDTNGDGIREGTCDGKEVSLVVNFETTDKQIRVDIATAAQADLKKIGIDFKLTFTPAGTFFGTYADSGKMAMGLDDMFGYTTGYYPDPYPSGGDWDCNLPNKDNAGGLNNYHVCDPKLVALLADVNKSADPAVRKVAIDAVQQYIYDNSYVVMMYARANVYGIVDRFDPGPFGFMGNMYWASETWTVK